MGGRLAGNGRSAVVGSVPYLRSMHNDMEAQFHHIEQEEHNSVLRAFKAQSDAITWEKESLIIELRKELRLLDEEHRELLGRVNADDIIQRIREWQQSGGLQSGLHSTAQPVHNPVPSPTVSASRKKQKTAQALASMSLSAPFPALHPQTVAASMQPSSSVVKRGAPTKGKKPKSEEYIAKGVREMKQRHTSSFLSVIEKGMGKKLRKTTSSRPLHRVLTKRRKTVGTAKLTTWPLILTRTTI